jgi:hypothetical protein
MSVTTHKVLDHHFRHEYQQQAAMTPNDFISTWWQM